MHFCGKTKPDGSPCYKSEKLENVIRYIKNVHDKELQKCQCGMQMKGSSISRHKKQSCRLRKPTATAPAIVRTTTTTTEETPPTNNEVENVKNYQIKMVTYKDGRVELIQDEIKIGNVSFILTARNDEPDNVDVNENNLIMNTMPPTPNSLPDDNTFTYDNDSVLITDVTLPGLLETHDEIYLEEPYGLYEETIESHGIAADIE